MVPHWLEIVGRIGDVGILFGVAYALATNPRRIRQAEAECGRIYDNLVQAEADRDAWRTFAHELAGVIGVGR